MRGLAIKDQQTVATHEKLGQSGTNVADNESIGPRQTVICKDNREILDEFFVPGV